ncbi:MAG: hypothetical protein ACYCU0_13355 [Solirubrobacteraceae bacterium]
MARILIIGGRERALALAQARIEAGDVARVVVGGRDGFDAVCAIGAEPWAGDPLRLGTLLGALDRVAIACWLLGDATGTHEELVALHGARLEAFLREAVDSTMRGFVYEAAGSAGEELLRNGATIAASVAGRNVIPLATIETPPQERERWLSEADSAVASLLGWA